MYIWKGRKIANMHIHRGPFKKKKEKNLPSICLSISSVNHVHIYIPFLLCFIFYIFFSYYYFLHRCIFYFFLYPYNWSTNVILIFFSDIVRMREKKEERNKLKDVEYKGWRKFFALR